MVICDLEHLEKATETVHVEGAFAFAVFGVRMVSIGKTNAWSVNTLEVLANGDGIQKVVGIQGTISSGADTPPELPLALLGLTPA